MSKAGTGIATPMGFTFDSDATLVENAVNAWDIHLDHRRAQSEHNAKVLARRVFRTDDIQFEYVKFAPETPTFDIEDEKIAFNGDFLLVEFCGDCGEDWKLRKFNSLATFGWAIRDRDDATEPFVCRECKYREALDGMKNKGLKNKGLKNKGLKRKAA